MSATIFTTGAVTYAKDDGGADVLRVVFGDDAPEAYHRVELPAGGRLETNGVISESFGRGGTTLEIVGLADLRKRGVDIPDKAKAAGFCWLTLDDEGLATCSQGNCSGACVKKYLLGVFIYCSCS